MSSFMKLRLKTVFNKILSVLNKAAGGGDFSSIERGVIFCLSRGCTCTTIGNFLQGILHILQGISLHSFRF